MNKITNPLLLPGFVGITLGMALLLIICTELVRLIPWIKEGLITGIEKLESKDSSINEVSEKAFF